MKITFGKGIVYSLGRGHGTRRSINLDIFLVKYQKWSVVMVVILRTALYIHDVDDDVPDYWPPEEAC